MEPHGALDIPWPDVVAVLGTVWPFALGAVLALIIWAVLHVMGGVGQ
jgi:uncharacterized membrane protein